MSYEEYQKLIIESIKEIKDDETLEFVFEVVKRLGKWGDEMSVKIKVSYTDEEEYREIMRLLSPVVKSWKMQPAKGKYKRAYGEKCEPIKSVHKKC